MLRSAGGNAYRPLTDAVFVAGGIFPTLAPEVCAASDALDYVLCGDAEAILKNDKVREVYLGDRFTL